MDTKERRRRVSEEAAEWWVQIQGEVSHAQREQYVEWLRESAVHVAEMLRVAQIHGAVEQFERWARISGDGAGRDDGAILTLPNCARSSLPRPALQNPRQLRRAGWVAAASVAAVTVLAAAMFFYLRDPIIQTDRAERREVALGDGSVLNLDPDTRLRIKYEARTRRVFLERGRALFHVAKDANRPFLVEADNTTVRAVGTAFAVETQSDSILVTVSEGKIAVFPAQTAERVAQSGAPPTAAVVQGADSQSPLANTPLQSQERGAVLSVRQTASRDASAGTGREIFLTANQQVVVARSGDAEPIHTVDSTRALAWADGRLIFDNTTVSDAIGQFNRYNRIQIHVHDAQLVHRPISGVFDATDPDSFVAFISSLAAVRVTRSPGTDISLDPIR